VAQIPIVAPSSIGKTARARAQRKYSGQPAGSHAVELRDNWAIVSPILTREKPYGTLASAIVKIEDDDVDGSAKD